MEDEGLAGTGGTGQAHHAHTGLAADGGHLQPQQSEVRGDSRRVVVGLNEYISQLIISFSAPDAAVYHPG